MKGIEPRKYSVFDIIYRQGRLENLLTYLFSKLKQVSFVSPWHREQLLHYTSTIPERLHSVHQSLKAIQHCADHRLRTGI